MRHNFLAGILIAIIVGCASVSSPTGGIKDEIPPELLSAKPKDQSVNFKGKEITLFFSEWMKVEQLNQELIITPRTNIEYEHNLKKQEFTLTFDKPLDDSTTYTLNFRKALKDITEGNLWENPRISFSTGPYLDSMEVSGNVQDIFTRVNLKDYTIGLYNPAYDTSNLRQGEPLYFTTTDENGYFNIRNIKRGNYLLFGFKDSNNNLINNPASEPYTFYADTLHLTDSIAPITLNSYKINEDTLKLSKSSPTGKDFKLNFNKGLSSYQIIPLSDTVKLPIYAMLESEAKDLRIFKENFPSIAFNTDSVSLQVVATDSLGMSRIDTVHAKFRESKVTNEAIKVLDKPKTDLISGQQKFKLRFNKPAHQINYDSIYIALDDSLVINIDSSQVSLSDNRHLLEIKAEILQAQIDTIVARAKAIAAEQKQKANAQKDSLNADSSSVSSDSIANIESTSDSLNIERDSIDTNKKDKLINTGKTKSKSNNQGKDLQTTNKAGANLTSGNRSSSSSQSQSKQQNFTPNLYFGKAAIVGIESDSLAQQSYNITFLDPIKHGIIQGKILNANSNFIIELTDEKYKVIDTIYNQTEYTFRYVKPGKYKIRVIIDENGNAKWDSGNPLTFKQPEQIIFLEELLTVKANWELIDKNIDLNPQENSGNTSEESEDKDVDKVDNNE